MGDKREAKEALSEAGGVQGIPSFAVLNPDGTIITTDGRSKVASDPKAESFPEGWLPQPFNNVNDDPSPLNEEQCLIMLGGEAKAAKACDAIKKVANEYYVAAGKNLDEMPMRFFSGPDGGVTDQLRKLTQQDSDVLILLDIPSDGAFYVCDKAAGDIDEGSVKAFIDSFKAGKLERKQLQK